MVTKSNRFGGEQPLPDYGCCDLGPIILPKFVLHPFTDKALFDIELFRKTVAIHVRFLDNVLDVTLWPLDKQKIESSSKRRIGLGFTGLANMLSMMGYAYNTTEGLKFADYVTKTMRDTAYMASVELAKERGSFPLFNAEKYLEDGTAASRLPNKIKEEIRKYGIRNSHLLSIAPVGTVSLAFADNASNGIEPPFSLAYTRKKRMPDGSKKEYAVVDHSLNVYLSTLEKNFADKLLDAIVNYKTTFTYGGKEFVIKDVLPKSIVTALDLTPTEHLAMMEVVQPYICSSISKTVNIPADYPFEDFKTVYDQAWKSKLKGVATYRPNSILGSVLSVGTKVEEKPVENKVEVAKVDEDPYNTFMLKRPNGTLSSKTKKVEYLSSGYIKDDFYVGVSFLNDIKRPIEVFFTVCPEGVSQEWLDSYAINLSLLARGGLNLFCKALRADRKVKSDKGQLRYGWYTKADGEKVPRFHTSEVACMAYAIQEILIEEGIITEQGFPVNSEKPKEVKTESKGNTIVPGKLCNECGAYAVIKKDSCSYCTNCHVTGECG